MGSLPCVQNIAQLLCLQKCWAPPSSVICLNMLLKGENRGCLRNSQQAHRTMLPIPHTKNVQDGIICLMFNLLQYITRKQTHLFMLNHPICCLLIFTLSKLQLQVQLSLPWLERCPPLEGGLRQGNRSQVQKVPNQTIEGKWHQHSRFRQHHFRFCTRISSTSRNGTPSCEKPGRQSAQLQREKSKLGSS